MTVQEAEEEKERKEKQERKEEGRKQGSICESEIIRFRTHFPQRQTLINKSSSSAFYLFSIISFILRL